MRTTRFVRPAVAVALLAGAAGAVPAFADDSPPPRVTGLSVVLDVVSTGSTIGANEVYTIGTSAVDVVLASPSIPTQLQPVTTQVFVLQDVPQQLFAMFQGPSATAIAEARTLIAPLAAYNADSNMVLDSSAAALVYSANRLHPIIQPADVNVIEVAGFLQSIEEQ